MPSTGHLIESLEGFVHRTLPPTTLSTARAHFRLYDKTGRNQLYWFPADMPNWEAFLERSRKFPPNLTRAFQASAISSRIDSGYGLAKREYHIPLVKFRVGWDPSLDDKPTRDFWAFLSQEFPGRRLLVFNSFDGQYCGYVESLLDSLSGWCDMLMDHDRVVDDVWAEKSMNDYAVLRTSGIENVPPPRLNRWINL